MDEKTPVKINKPQAVLQKHRSFGRRNSALFLVMLSIVLLLSLIACSPSVKDDGSKSEATTTTSAPSATSGGGASGGSATTAVGPYNYSYVVNSDFIFKGEILSADYSELHLEYEDFGLITTEDSVQCLLTVRIDKVYWGKAPENKKEIVVYCPTSDETVIGPALSLTSGKEYVFFSRDWTDEETIETMDYKGMDYKGLSQRSDFFIRHPGNNLAIVKDGYVLTDGAWAEIVSPSKPYPRFEADSEGKPTEAYQEAFDAYYGEWLKLTEGYAIEKDGPDSIVVFSAIYTEEDFSKALAELQKLYPEE